MEKQLYCHAIFRSLKPVVKSALTEHRPGRDRLPIQPEGDLRQDDGHEARHVGLDDKVSDLSLQVEVGHHHCVEACVNQKKL